MKILFVQFTPPPSLTSPISHLPHLLPPPSLTPPHLPPPQSLPLPPPSHPHPHIGEWWTGDVDDIQGDLLNDIITSENLFQLAKVPTHIIGQSLFCIVLVITDQPNIINDCCIVPSLHTRCRHQINHIELNVPNPPPPPYVRRIWHYQRANNWERELSKLSNPPNEQAKFFSKTFQTNMRR